MSNLSLDFSVSNPPVRRTLHRSSGHAFWHTAQVIFYEKKLITLSIISLISLVMCFLLQENTLATHGFSLEEEKIAHLELQREIEEWDVALATPQSLYALEETDIAQSMESIPENIVIYVK